MLVSFQHRLAILAMPKCASTALHAALGPHMDLAIARPPGAKHTPYRKFDQHLRRFLESHTDGRIETLSLIREPVDWLGSWWRYRARPGMPHAARSTAGVDFATFVAAYLDGGAAYARVGRPSQFLAARDGATGVDHLWRYDHLDACADWLAARLGVAVALPRVNVSPDAGGPLTLPSPLRARLEHEMAADLHLYHTVAR